MRSHTVVTIALALACANPLAAQTVGKKPLSHDVYDIWRRIVGESLSPDGTWLLYTLEPGEGDARLVVVNLRTGAADTIARGVEGKFTADSRFAAFGIKAMWADIRKARNAKKKPDDRPKDSLGIMDLSARSVAKIPRVRSFTIPDKASGWMAYQLEKKLPDSSTVSRPAKHDAEGEQSGAEKDEKGTTVILRELATAREIRFEGAKSFTFSRSGAHVLIAVPSADSAGVPGLYRFSTATGRIDTIARGSGKYSMLALDDEGRQAACVADRDTSKSKQRYPRLLYWAAGMDSSAVLADSLNPAMPPHWLVSDNGTVWFSRDGSRLYFGTAPVPMPDDTTLIEEETAKLDVWNWQDPLLQPEQLKELDREKKRSYLAVIHLADRRMVQLADSSLPAVSTVEYGNSATALGLSSLDYRQETSWENGRRYDVSAVDVTTGRKTMLLKGVRGTPSLSPGGSFIAWYDYPKRAWFAMPTAGGPVVSLTAGIKTPFANELNDLPDDPDSYGLAGWFGRDSLVLIYDRYDIWRADPSGSRPTVCLTHSDGRTHRQRFRYERLDPEEQHIPGGKVLTLRVFDETTKSEGFASLDPTAEAGPRMLALSPYDFGSAIKAKDTTVLVVHRSSFREPADLYLTGPSFRDFTRLTDSNPQQSEYLWGNVELVSWKPPRGGPLQGLLYTPEGFDRKKTYPMIVYYYERNSDLLHRYFTPAPSASTVNPALYASRGYIVFIPDIRYRIGHPGESALECVVSGVKALLKRGGIDRAHIGLQGQSWGGYQTAFIVTRTRMFAAAMAGAPVSNMTSAYGGIRWGTGLSRMFQYEHAQSRIGATLWERPDLYLENSPLFRADSVFTPLLMMHNDDDGAVPWYQGIEYFTALRRLHKPVWMLTYNGEEHNLVKRKNRKDLSIRMLQFFDHYLMGQPAPRWMTEGIPAINKGKTMGYELTTE
jgi:dipeptidyl aminopeptidase/acylaminoacyl peptidase